MNYLNVVKQALINLVNKLKTLCLKEKTMEEPSPLIHAREVQAKLRAAQAALARGNQAAALETKKPVADLILDAIAVRGRLTRRELARYTGREISSLCAALKTLTKQGVIRADATTTCPITGKEVTLYDLKEVR